MRKEVEFLISEDGFGSSRLMQSQKYIGNIQYVHQHSSAKIEHEEIDQFRKRIRDYETEGSPSCSG